MTAIVLAMVVILGVAALTAGVVVMGMEGRGTWRAPWLARRLTRAAHYLDEDLQHSSR